MTSTLREPTNATTLSSSTCTEIAFAWFAKSSITWKHGWINLAFTGSLKCQAIAVRMANSEWGKDSFTLFAIRYSPFALRPDGAGHESFDRGDVFLRQTKAELGAPPQHVVGGLGPFVPHEITDLGAGEASAEARAEILFARHIGEDELDASAVGGDQPAGMRLGEERPGAAYLGHQRVIAAGREIAARQGPFGGPRFLCIGKEAAELGEHGFGESAIGGGLAAIDVEKRRRTGVIVEGEQILARGLARAAGAVVIKRAHAGEGPDHIDGRKHRAEIGIHRIAQIADLARLDGRHRRIADEILVGRADQGEVRPERAHEHDAPVGRRQDVGAVMLEQALDHDMAALVEPHR